MEFNAVVFDIAEILENGLGHTNNIEKFKCLCYGLTTNDQLFFSAKEKAAIKSCKTFHELFSEVRRSMRWDSHRLLNIIIIRAGMEEAVTKLKQFEKKIDCQMKLKDIHDIFKAKDEPLPDGYTEMIAIVEKDYTHITLDEFKEIEDFLSIHLNELPPCKRAKYYSVRITWYIPTDAVPLLLQKAYQAREFLVLQPTIVYIAIAGVMVWDKNGAYSPQV